MFAKIDVNGDAEAALYTMMKADQPGDGDSADVKWNFEKFLIDPQGETVARWDTPVSYTHLTLPTIYSV